MNDDYLTMGRRGVLAATASAIAGGVAGCLGAQDGPTATTAPGTLSTPSLGPGEADVTVAVFKDYACPHCATFTADVEPRLRSEYVADGTVRLAHYDFPIPVREPASFEAASAARAVQAGAGDEAFFAYADRLFASQSDLGPGTYADLAESVDGEVVRRAAEGRVYRNTVQADRQTGIDRGVRGTPAVFVDGDGLDGWNWDAVRSAIEDARGG